MAFMQIQTIMQPLPISQDQRVRSGTAVKLHEVIKSRKERESIGQNLTLIEFVALLGNEN